MQFGIFTKVTPFSLPSFMGYTYKSMNNFCPMDDKGDYYT